MKIYVVMGTTGEYSNQNEWPVCWCANQELAADLVSRFTRLAAEHVAHHKDKFDYYDSTPAPEFDPKFKCDKYTGTSYYLVEVEENDPQVGRS